MLFWTCPECGRECSPAIRDCPGCTAPPTTASADSGTLQKRSPGGDSKVAVAQSVDAPPPAGVMLALLAPAAPSTNDAVDSVVRPLVESADASEAQTAVQLAEALELQAEQVLDSIRAQREAEKRARREAEKRAKREAEERAKREAEQRAQREAEQRAKQEAEERARLEAEARAKQEAEERARLVEARAKQEAEERTRLEAEARAKQEAEERARLVEARAKQEAEERARLEAEARAKQEAEERAQREAERRAKQQAEERAQREAEERTQREAVRREIQAVAATFQERPKAPLLPAAVEVVKAPAPPILQRMPTPRPTIAARAPKELNLAALVTGPQSSSLAGPCLPAELHHLIEEPPSHTKRGRKHASFPTWIVSVLLATGLFLGTGAVLQHLTANRDANAAPASTPRSAEPAKATAVTPPAEQNTLGSVIEIAGLRFVRGWNHKPQLQYIVINHSVGDLSGVTMQIQVRSSNDVPLFSFDAVLPSLGALQSKEIRSDVGPDVNVSDVPDWQHLRVEATIHR